MSNVSDADGYLLDNQQTGAEARLNALSDIFDPITFRHLTAMGIGPGWRCWEVGAGGPNVAAWMAGQVGATGRVLATDIDVTWLPSHAEFDVLQHDVGRQSPPATGFDLIHARLVLVHTPQRQAALASLIGALRPGGQLLVEDADPGLQPLLCPDESGPDQVLANRLREGFRSLMRERGADLAFGRTLPRRLREAGLVDVQADAYFPIASPACTVLERTTIAQIRQLLVERHLATEADIERHLANVGTGSMDLATSPLISAWGRSQ
jgi:SAM-dependent methyltransferase